MLEWMALAEVIDDRTREMDQARLTVLSFTLSCSWANSICEPAHRRRLACDLTLLQFVLPARLISSSSASDSSWIYKVVSSQISHPVE